MGRASPIQNSFNAGEFSPRAAGRTDIAKYGAACALLEGFIPVIQGPAQRRGGFRYVAEVRSSATRTWLMPFEFNTTQAYQLEFGTNYIRFYANHGQVIVSGVSAWVTGHLYSVGDLVITGGLNYYCQKQHTSGTFATDFSAGDWYTLVGSIFEIPSPYNAADLTDSDGNFRLRFVESADIIYITHPSYAPRKLSRLGPTTWTLTTMMPSGGPFKDQNITSTTVYADAVTGNVTLTASSAIFSASNVGSLFQLAQKSVVDIAAWEAGKTVGAAAMRRSDGKNYLTTAGGTTGGNKPTHTSGSVIDGDTGVAWIYQDPGFGCVLITGFTDSTHVTGTVVSPFPSNPGSQLPFDAVTSGKATTRWSFAAWSDIEGWPTCVGFYAGRLAFGRKQTVWLSVAGDYETFTAIDNSSLITSDMAITEQLQSSKVNDIQWMEANSSSVDALVCGTAGSEFVLKGLTDNVAYGTDNHTAVMISTLGSHASPPVHVGNVLLFIQRAGSKLRDVTYDFYSNQFQSVDQSVLAEHIPKIGINQIVYQQEPYSLIWGVRSDGLLVCMTYSREQYPDAPHGGWHRHPVGGSAITEALSVISAPDNSRNELWAINRRTINGVTKRYVEYMEWERRPNDDEQDQFYVDAGLTFTNKFPTTLQPGVGATVARQTGVLFTMNLAIFSSTNIGHQIAYRYSTSDSEGVLTFASGKATITGLVDASNVLCTIDEAFPNLNLIPSSGWSLSVNAVSGLTHLEGQLVDILADGASHPQRTVVGGSFTLQQPATKVQVGLAFSSKLKTMRVNAGAQDGTTQGKKARMNRVVVRLLETGSLQYGINFDPAQLIDFDFRTAFMAMDNPPAIFGKTDAADITLDWPGEYDTNPWMCFNSNQPMAATIVALMPQISASEQG